MFLVPNATENYRKMIEDRYQPIVDRSNIYMGQVTLVINPMMRGVEDEFPCHDIHRGGFTCRSILFSMEDLNKARDFLNKDITYQVLPKFDCNAQLELPFEVDDSLHLERLLTMDVSMFDFDSLINKDILTEQEKKSLVIARNLLEQLKFNKRLNSQDMIRLRSIFLNDSNLNKLAILFGHKRYSTSGAFRNNFVENNIGSLFPKGYFGELTPEQVWDKLTSYNNFSYRLSKYEKPKGMVKYFKGVE